MPWPSEAYAPLGCRVNGRVLLQKVSLWSEILRLLIGQRIQPSYEHIASLPALPDRYRKYGKDAESSPDSDAEAPVHSRSASGRATSQLAAPPPD